MTEHFPNDCVDPDQAYLFVRGGLASDIREQVEAHIDGCSDCRRLLAETARGASVFPTEPDVPSPYAQTKYAPAASTRAALFVDSGTRIGRYVVERPLGAGGMGVVSLAWDPELHRHVTVKLLRPELVDANDTQGTRARLQREAQAMARISHVNVVQVFDVGVWEGQVFLAMEYVEGGSLDQWLAQGRTASEICQALHQAALGLLAAHRAGLVHRDFKPHNVLVRRDGVVKVTDFGLARAAVSEDTPRRTPAHPESPVLLLETPVTRTGALVGTPAYMAPEQLAGENPSPSSDQFSFCVTAYEAFFGIRPFDGDDGEALRSAILAQRLEKPRSRVHLRPSLERAILRGLRPAPAERYPTMEGLVEAFEKKPLRRSVVVAFSLLVAATAVTIGWMASSESAPPPEARDASARASDATPPGREVHWFEKEYPELVPFRQDATSTPTTVACLGPQTHALTCPKGTHAALEEYTSHPVRTCFLPSTDGRWPQFLRHGPSLDYFKERPNRIERASTYASSRRFGPAYEFDIDGHLVEIQTYRAAKKHGYRIGCSPKGEITELRRFDYDRPVGIMRHWLEDGSVLETHYSGGVRVRSASDSEPGYRPSFLCRLRHCNLDETP